LKGFLFQQQTALSTLCLTDILYVSSSLFMLLILFIRSFFTDRYSKFSMMIEIRRFSMRYCPMASKEKK